MEDAVRHFARKVLLIHLALLVGLLVFVLVAVREVYQSAWNHALEQTEKRQSMLSQQTARGVQAYYDSILTDLELMRPIDPEDPDSEYVPPRPPTTQPSAAIARGAGPLLGAMLGRQLEGRLSHLFSVDQATLRVRWSGIGREETSPSIGQIIEGARPWLKQLRRPEMGEFLVFGDRGFHLIAIPSPPGSVRPSILIGAVPMRRIEHWFLDELQEGGLSASFLVNDSLQILNAARSELVGVRLSEKGDPEFRDAIESLAKDGFSGTRVLGNGFRVGDDTFGAALVSTKPVRVSNKHWFILVASPLADVGAVVKQIFRRALFWAIFLACSMTAILLSTASQLIRNRSRIEQFRHDLLDREIQEARKIQLAWLPQDKPADPALELAPINQPASHISGDFYNWFELPDGRTAIAIGDVTGHGMSASFLMAATQLLIRSTLPGLCDPGRCLRQVNQQLCTQAFNGQFVSMILLIIDSRSRTIEVGMAGHPLPLICGDNVCRPINADTDMVLGVEHDSNYVTHRFTLEAGEHLLLYTDGIVETEGADNQQFGLDRLSACLCEPRESAEEMVASVVEAVESFRQGRATKDDLTLVAIRIASKVAERGSRDLNLSERSESVPRSVRGEEASTVGV